MSLKLGQGTLTQNLNWIPKVLTLIHYRGIVA